VCVVSVDVVCSKFCVVNAMWLRCAVDIDEVCSGEVCSNEVCSDEVCSDEVCSDEVCSGKMSRVVRCVVKVGW
jgi:hypothetical protein